MRTLRALLKLVRPSHLPGLCWYLLARGVYRLTGVTLFHGIALTFREVTVYLRPDFPSGLRFIVEIVAEHSYAAFAKQSIGAVLLDVGANVGLFTLDRCAANPRLQAYCLEPHPVTASLLRTNLELNALSARAHAFNCAASDASGVIFIEQCANNNMARTLADDGGSAAAGTEVTCWRLDDFCQTHGVKPDLLKIDVEGHEVAVLKGATRVLDEVREIVLECHSAALLASCRQLLEPHGFTLSDRDGLLFGEKAQPGSSATP